MKRKAEDQLQGNDKRGRAEGDDYQPSRSLYLANVDSMFVSVFDIVSLANQYGAVDMVNIIEKKNCAFLNFLDEASALAFYQAHANSPPVFNEKLAPSPVSWAKSKPLPEDLKAAVEAGATRNLWVGNIAEGFTEDALAAIFVHYMPFENIVVSPQGFAFINLSSVAHAVAAKSVLDGYDFAGRKMKINFAKEKIGKPTKPPRRPHFVTKMLQPGWADSIRSGHSFTPPFTFMQQQAAYSQPSYPHAHSHAAHPHAHPPAYPQPSYAHHSHYPQVPMNRSIFLSGVTEEVSLHDLCTLANRFGSLESLSVIRPKLLAFINFVDPGAALAMYTAHSQNPFTLSDTIVKIDWSIKTEPISEPIANAIRQGATRNLYLGNIEPHITEDVLRETIGPHCDHQFDSISVLPEKHIAFVNLTSVRAAFNVRDALRDRKVGSPPVLLRVNFAKEVLGGRKGGLKSVISTRNNNRREAKAQEQPAVHLEIGTGGGEGSGSRAVYVGNLPDDITPKDLCALANSFGALEELTMLPDKKCCFINYLDWRCAAKLVEEASKKPVMLRGKQVKLNFARGIPIDAHLAEQVQHGATRNLFLGSVPVNATAETLAKYFAFYGPFESVAVLPKKQCAFINLLSLRKAIEAKNAFSRDPGAIIDGSRLIIAFAKEKIGFPVSSSVSGADGRNRSNPSPPAADAWGAGYAHAPQGYGGGGVEYDYNTPSY